MLTFDIPKADSTGYAYEKQWHGLSCSCGGGYRVGHRTGCQWADRDSNLKALAADLERARANDDSAEVAELERIKAAIES